ncbi:ATP-dependent DNA helicase Q1-like [Culicoides brevitarsis]|uniref:ATP-dependent DNA helicase Q1-like n=1 Tax=Culicoides brevitarsis TaxID=469753 RepID=UPI00307B2A85
MTENDPWFERELQKVDRELLEVEKQLSKLTIKRRKLLELKESLKNKQLQKKAQELSSQDWEGEEYPWSAKVREILKKTFKLRDFRPQQLRTINAILSKQDVLLLAPTGGGKSLCFQLPACVTSGITIVISPLLSLCEDQIWSLARLGIDARMLNSTTDKESSSTIHKLLSEKGSNCPMKLLYVTPERLAKSKRFMNCLQKAHGFKKLDRFAIDEVHCCSQWGHDFRPDYKFLGTLKTLFPDIPILGVTATATQKVIADVQKMLNIKHSLLFSAPFNRPNLYYHVLEKPSEKEKVIELLADLLKNRYKGMSGIIYTFSIKDAEELTSELLQRDIRVRPYHANLDSDKRTRIHSRWLNGEIQAVIGTVAFGMGIDKSNVRFVIHHTIGKSMENFYQESGRAGRDANYAECILLYRLPDIFKITTMMFSEHTGLKNAYSMVEYCINGSKCRRTLIAAHFSDVWEEYSCGKMCDHCYYADRPQGRKIDVTEDCRALRRIIRRADELKQNLTALKLVDAWLGKGPSTLRFEAVPSYERFYAEQIIAFLIINDYLKEEFNFTPYTTYSYIKVGPEIIPETGITFQCARIYKLPSAEKLNKTPTKARNSNLDDEEEAEEVVFVSSTEKKKRKRVVVEESSDDEEPLVTRSTPIAKRHSTNGVDESQMSVKEEESIEIYDELEETGRRTCIKSEGELIEVCEPLENDVIHLD